MVGELDNKGTGGESPTKPEAEQSALMLARQIQEAELSYRRTHRWNIFSWASGLLLGGIGGLFAISRLSGAAPQQAAAAQQAIVARQKMALIAAIFIFSAYASIWLRYHYKRERCAIDNLARIYDELLVDLEPKLTEPSACRPRWLLSTQTWFSKKLKKLSLLTCIIEGTSFDEITVILLGIVAIFAAWLI
jgi:hypothetical protein